jgi:hypothetical protein
MCRNTDVLIPNDVRRSVKGGICILKRKCRPKSAEYISCSPAFFISAFLPTFLPRSLSLLLPFFHSFNLLSGPSTLRLSFFPLSIIPSFIFPFYSFRSVILSSLITSFHSSCLPPFTCPSIISCFHALFSKAFPSYFLAFLFLPSFICCFRSSLFPSYFQLNFFPPAFLYGNRGHANTVDSKSRRRTSVYWYDRRSKVLKTNNCARC